MTELDLQYLKQSIDKVVEIKTTDGEHLVAKILFVTHDEDYGEHDVLYQVISSDRLASYKNIENSGGYVLDFERILSVTPL